MVVISELYNLRNNILREWINSSYSFSIENSELYTLYKRRCENVIEASVLEDREIVIYSMSTGKGFFEALLIVDLWIDYFGVSEPKIVLLIDDPFVEKDSILFTDRVQSLLQQEICVNEQIYEIEHVDLVVGVQVQVFHITEEKEAFYHRVLELRDRSQYGNLIVQMEHSFDQRTRFDRMARQIDRPVLLFFMPTGPVEFEQYNFDSFYREFFT